MTKLFLTGATGLLGKEVVRQFHATGVEITALKRANSNISDLPETIHWITGNLEDPLSYLNQIEEADVVVHMAAKVSFNPKRARSIIDFNVNTTKEIVNACLEHNKKMIYVSSVAALGDLKSQMVTEQSDFDLNGTNTAYAKSKYLAEIEVQRGIAEGLQAIIVNPSIIIGEPANWYESTGSFWQRIDKGVRHYPQGSTGFVDVKDVAKAIVQLYQKELFGEQFIVNGSNASYQSFFQLIHQSLNKSTQLKPMPKWVGGILWRLAKVVNPLGLTIPFSKALVKTMNSNVEYSSEKLQQAIGINFTPLAQSVNEASASFLATKKG